MVRVEFELPRIFLEFYQVTSKYTGCPITDQPCTMTKLFSYKGYIRPDSYERQKQRPYRINLKFSDCFPLGVRDFYRLFYWLGKCPSFPSLFIHKSPLTFPPRVHRAS